MVGLNKGPEWAPVRHDPRFQDLHRRMNFPGSRAVDEVVGLMHASGVSSPEPVDSLIMPSYRPE